MGNLPTIDWLGPAYSIYGGLAQLARAPALHAGGHRFDSDILHIGNTLPLSWPKAAKGTTGMAGTFIDILGQGAQKIQVFAYAEKETRK